MKVRELVTPETTRVHLGWSDNLTDWNNAVLLDADYYSDGSLSSSYLELDSPNGMVRK